MKLQQLNIQELEGRFEMSLTAEDPSIDPDTYVIDMVTGM